MKQEYDERQESDRQRNIKAAKFPYIKTLDELDLSRFEHVDAAYLKELASCEFVKQKIPVLISLTTALSEFFLTNRAVIVIDKRILPGIVGRIYFGVIFDTITSVLINSKCPNC